MKQAAEGNTKALGQLQQAAAADYIVNIKADGDTESVVEARNKLGDLIKNTELPSLEAGVQLEGYDDFIAQCNQLIADAGLTSDQVQEAFAKWVMMLS